MVLTAQFQCEGYDAGTKPGQEKFPHVKGENSDAGLERALEHVRSHNLDPARWVIVRDGGEKACHYLKYCRDDAMKRPRRVSKVTRRVYYIIDVPVSEKWESWFLSV